MPPYKVNTLEQWEHWYKWLKHNGYYPWQFQHRWNAPEGFHVWFMKAGEKDIELITHKEEIQKVIMKFKSPSD